VMARAAGTG